MRKLLKINEIKFGGSDLHLAGLTDNYDSAMQLIKSCEARECFLFEGGLFSGEIVFRVRQFFTEKPDKSFRTWLIDAGYQIGE